MNLTKLVLTKPLGSDMSSSLTIAVKMQVRIINLISYFN